MRQKYTWKDATFKVGDKIEVTDSVDDSVQQGWVDDIDLTSISGVNFRRGPIVKFKGREPFQLRATDDIRVLVSINVHPEEGDVIRGPVAADLRPGTIITNNSSVSGHEWVVMKNREEDHVFLSTKDCGRVHLHFTGHYRVVRVPKEK